MSKERTSRAAEKDISVWWEYRKGMETIRFSGHGIEIIERGDKLFVRTDSGEIVGYPVEIEITHNEAEIMQKSEQDAYQVLLRRWSSRVDRKSVV